jgi:hypothetical protein
MKLRERDVSNLGHIGSIIAHMMQTVTSTTLRMEPFLYKDLGRLLYGPHIRRFNMFFLDSLDLQDPNVLSGACIPATDEAFVHRRLGSAPKPIVHKKRNGLPLISAKDQENPNNHSRKITWTAIKNTLETCPHQLITGYVWPGHLTVYLNAEDDLRRAAGTLFIMLTNSLWTLLKDSHKQEPFKKINVLTLQDAIQFWSLDNIQAALQSPCLQAISTEATGRSGRHREGFGSEEQVELFFHIGKGGGWQCLDMTVGQTYAETVNTHKGADKERQLKDYLGELLAACQFLPDSNHSHVWSHKQGQIIVNSNPRYWNVNVGVSVHGPSVHVSHHRAPLHKGQKEFMADILRLEQPTVSAAVIRETYRTWQSYKKVKSAPSVASRNKKKTAAVQIPAAGRSMTRSKAKAALKNSKVDDLDWSPGNMSDESE